MRTSDDPQSQPHSGDSPHSAPTSGSPAHLRQRRSSNSSPLVRAFVGRTRAWFPKKSLRRRRPQQCRPAEAATRSTTGTPEPPATSRDPPAQNQSHQLAACYRQSAHCSPVRQQRSSNHHPVPRRDYCRPRAGRSCHPGTHATGSRTCCCRCSACPVPLLLPPKRQSS